MPYGRTPLLVLALALGLAACAPGGDLPPLRATAGTGYRLGPGDQVRIITVGDEALTGEFRVGDSGRLALPMLGSVPAAGLRPAGLEAAVARALVHAGLERDPSVSVEVTGYRPIFVLGEVNKPGQFAYQPGMTVLAAVALAGGFTYRAVEGYAGVVRGDGGTAVEGRAARQTELAPGDVVTVFERRF
ncbi:MAG: polysaccharide biosynthesis/export family protein [Acetobacteraceae bacterium]